jgi:signal transduction histidine kinase
MIQVCTESGGSSKHLNIAVVDTGTGIPHEKQCDIWEPFVSMDGSTGLGLYVVRKQSEMIGGECGFNERADGLHGCEFW